MKNALFILFFSLVSAFTSPAAFGAVPYITEPDVRIVNNNIIVNTTIADLSDLEQMLKGSIGKEVILTVELMRVWNFWPDEFIVSKKITKVVKYDNLRNRYRVSWRDGITRVDNVFTDFTVMKNWLLSEDDIDVANIRELDPGSYYIRVIVESKSRERIPLIGLLMYLLPEVEMSLAKESRQFTTGTEK